MISVRALSPSLRTGSPRKASAVLEMMIGLPILILMTLGVVQFGIFYINLQELELACRVGAIEASQTVGLNATLDGDPVPANVVTAIEQQLLSSSQIIHCRIRLEHNVGGIQKELSSPMINPCDCGPNANLVGPLPAGEYVRVTVCAELEEIMPNFLMTFGFNTFTANKTVEFTNLFRYEL